MNAVVDFLSGNFSYCMELTLFFMAYQGAMVVRSGPNKDGQMHWFHAYVKSILTGLAGGWFGTLWLGLPAAVMANDVAMAAGTMAFVLANLPGGREFGNSLPVAFFTTMFAQLFRALGIVKFVSVGFNQFQSSPSAYYPIPVIGPILYGIMLGNMGGLVLKGIDGYLANGMPWPFQNGACV